jgi:pimeloyl-ACP methyl ester carboxylesterase
MPDTTATTELTHGEADVGGGVRLHYVEAGPADGLPVVLLHGFPEFWYSWRRQLPALAAAGLRAIAPDMRGYNLSDKPRGRRAYDTDRLADDVAGLIGSLGVESAHVVGHDWGGVAAYATAMRHPEVVRRLVVLNVPHPARMIAALRTVRQLRRSWYVFMFQIPALPERLLAHDDYAFAKRSLRAGAARGAFGNEDLELYAQAWSQPGALTGMLNYYRAIPLRTPGQTLAAMTPIVAPTLVIWGERDRYIGSELAEPEPRWVPDVRVQRIPDATHWVQHEAPERVNELLVEFLRDG